MLGIVSEDSNHNKTFKHMAGATLGQGVPLGAWCSFEADVAPSSNWLRAGTTFDSNTYPALALYLGTNQVPYRYDHSRLGDLQAISFSANTDVTMPYDGILYETSPIDYTLTLNGTLIVQKQWGNYSNVYSSATVIFKKGDVLRTDRQISTQVQYYKHPLFIKATSIASDTDQQAILAQIQAFNTYSTEETLTGKTWIENGVEKPIYRKVIQGTVIPINGTTALGNVSRIIKQEGYLKDNNIWYIESRNEFNLTLNEQTHNVEYYFRYNAGLSYDWYFTIEYTKTV